MKLRVVALPLIAAICLGSSAMASTSTTDEQQVRGRGARDRGGDSTRGAQPRSGGDNTGNSGGDRRTGKSGGGNTDNQRTARRRDGGDRTDNQRTATRRDADRDRNRNNTPPVVVRNRPNVNINFGSSYRGPRYYSPVRYDQWARNYYRWSPLGYAPWSLIYGSVGFANFGVSVGSPYYAYGSPYGYGPSSYSTYQVSGYDIGGVRLRVRPRDAQVFVDGFYAGLVDDFDGTFQSLRMDQGGHKIQIRLPGFEDLELDIHIQAGRTITLSEDLRVRP